MTGEQLYVSHAPGDLELVQELFSTVKNFPIGVHIALEEIESGRSRTRLTGRISNSDVVAVVLTEQSATNQWVNQEIGYAQAKGIPILPLYDHEQLRGGFVGDIEGVTIDRQNLSVTVFNLLCRLRSELAPLGALSVPNWYVEFPCTSPGCTHSVTLEIERAQTKLWKLHRRGRHLTADCAECETRYYFDPGTIGFVGREDRHRQRH
ncbi:toll/interleukin-1 receptor domain-containing protein [Natronolimnobius sp. AArcel1]|uniref:toll/interleukin-1 receptor domain-containing protein n=1 Tax=Natronolimnobius sp. AArcel1 TaxID=1679093 RepID=UPI0013EA5DAF|nr:toll/interleukin-1 receptor domain-containing protein [Natronolimnobius sp. AArcel1]NGM67497.1 toll/interleukin-1 receptor domain-containing protein [Natronolimnobius sp. AArcel1]